MKHHRSKKTDPIPRKECATCKKIFEKKRKDSWVQWRDKKYCSRSCVHKGKPSPFKGMRDRWPDEWKIMMSKNNAGIRSNTGRTHIKKGQHLSRSTELKKGNKPWNTGKKNPYFAGPNNPNWKGGIYPEHLRIRHSPEMKRWREEVFKRDNFTCVLCGRKRKTGDRVVLHADHIKPFAKYPKLRLSLKNGRTLCKECHLKTDTHGVNLS